MNSPEATNRPHRSTRVAAAFLAVFALAVMVPLATTGGTARAFTWSNTFSGEATVTTPCYAGGQPIVSLGVGDRVDGVIEILIPRPGFSVGVWAPATAATWTSGPKVPFRYTASVSGPLMGCVQANGMMFRVTYTVVRAPLWAGVAANAQYETLAQ